MARVAAFFQLGTDLDPGSRQSQAEEQISVPSTVSKYESSDDRKDFFIERDGLRFAGVHLIIDLHEAERLDDLGYVERALRDCITASKASLLHIHLHHFTPNGGVSGVAVLAESHVSVHTWPECGYAAFDVFMCGNTEPHRTVEVLRRAFRPGRISVSEYLRGGER
jgi:S-adenosylmethionine decarboxylase